MTGWRLAVTLALAAAGIACTAVPAAATFSGRNGEILLIQSIGAKYSSHQFSLLRFAPRLSEPMQHPSCWRLSSDEHTQCMWLGAAAVSPDGSRLASVAAEGAYGLPRWALWFLSSGGERTASVPLRSQHEVLSWSPDGSELLAASPEGVVVLGLDGSERRLVAAGATDADWCADGRIVVERYGELILVGRTGATRKLTWRGGTEPSCAPSGRKVAFTRREAVWTMPIAGRRARRLATGHSPAWSPDGRQIAFLRARETPGAIETHLHRIGLRRHVRRRVSLEPLTVEDGYSDMGVQGPEWRPLSRSGASPSG